MEYSKWQMRVKNSSFLGRKLTLDLEKCFLGCVGVDGVLKPCFSTVH